MDKIPIPKFNPSTLGTANFLLGAAIAQPTSEELLANKMEEIKQN